MNCFSHAGPVPSDTDLIPAHGCHGSPVRMAVRIERVSDPCDSKSLRVYEEASLAIGETDFRQAAVSEPEEILTPSEGLEGHRPLNLTCCDPCGICYHNCRGSTDGVALLMPS